jgi:hypothetical protein
LPEFCIRDIKTCFEEDHAIGIIHPHGIGAKMELGTVLFGVAELRDQKADQNALDFHNIMILSFSIKGPGWYPSPC